MQIETASFQLEVRAEENSRRQRLATVRRKTYRQLLSHLFGVSSIVATELLLWPFIVLSIIRISIEQLIVSLIVSRVECCVFVDLFILKI